MKKTSILQRMEHGEKCLIGMVHCLPLPGTLNYGGNIDAIYEKALLDARTLAETGFDAIIVENTSDLPFVRQLETQQLTTLAGVTRSVVQAVSLPVGVSASFSDTASGLAIAYTTGAQFVRCPVFVDSVRVTGLGVVEPCVAALHQMRRQLSADDIAVFADVQVKHSHMVDQNVSIEESVCAATDCGAHAIIVTGLSTGIATPLETVRRAKAATRLPIIIGSGFSIDNAVQQLDLASGAIVGSSLKACGAISALVDRQLCEQMVAVIRGKQ